VRILAIDTSSSITAVAVVQDGQVRAEDDSPGEAKHGEVILPRIRAVLQRADCPLEQLDLIAVGVGPGSFTGLRVGLATAKGLALATGVPIRGVSSLRALARGALEAAAGQGAASVPEATVLTWLDAYRGEVFGALHRGTARGELRELRAPFHAAPAEALSRVAEQARGALICGDGLRRYAEQLGEGAIEGATVVACDHPHGRHVAIEAAALHAIEGPSDLATLEPTYLRGSDAKLPDQPLAT
jgi:tRNA threonylcarbamoyladenosine biosynthesis protein TsaB